MDWKKIIKGCLRIVFVTLEACLEISSTKNQKSFYSTAEAMELFEKGEISYKQYEKAMRGNF